MSVDEYDADYYRRRAAREMIVAEQAPPGRVQDLHRELAGLYEARARIHANRVAGGGMIQIA